jgi:hypothetical protein
MGFHFEINDFKGPSYFSHSVPSEGLPTLRHSEGLAPNLLPTTASQTLWPCSDARLVALAIICSGDPSGWGRNFDPKWGLQFSQNSFQPPFGFATYNRGIYSPPKGFPFAEAGQNIIFPCNNSNMHGSEPSMSVPNTKRSSSTFLIVMCRRQRWSVRNHPFSELAQNKLFRQIGSFPKWSSTWKLLSPSSPVIIAARQWPVHSCLCGMVCTNIAFSG